MPGAAESHSGKPASPIVKVNNENISYLSSRLESVFV